MPNIVKYIDKNREESSRSIEKLLIHNLELYNTDKENDLWNESIECINIDINDLLEEARTRGYYNLEEIDYAIMESSGKISFLPKVENKLVKNYGNKILIISQFL